MGTPHARPCLPAGFGTCVGRHWFRSLVFLPMPPSVEISSVCYPKNSLRRFLSQCLRNSCQDFSSLSLSFPICNVDVTIYTYNLGASVKLSEYSESCRVPLVCDFPLSAIYLLDWRAGWKLPPKLSLSRPANQPNQFPYSPCFCTKQTLLCILLTRSLPLLEKKIQWHFLTMLGVGGSAMG